MNDGAERNSLQLTCASDCEYCEGTGLRQAGAVRVLCACVEVTPIPESLMSEATALTAQAVVESNGAPEGS